MRSNICKIEKGTRDLYAILKESERVAEYNGLSHKQALQLRLLCEEIDGMLPNIIEDFDGDFWIEQENLSFKFVKEPVDISLCIHCDSGKVNRCKAEVTSACYDFSVLITVSSAKIVYLKK